jgi:integrase/recombinase XerD
MLKIQKRHTNQCRYSEYDRSHTRCKCSYWAVGVLNGDFIRKSLKTSSYDDAQEIVMGWGAAGRAAQADKPVAIADAVAAFMRDIAARNWQETTQRKFRTLLEHRLLAFSNQQSLRGTRDLNLNPVTEFRATWKDAPLTALKNLERLRAFFRFCVERGWMTTNPAEKLKVKVSVEEKDPFDPEEFDRILEATHLYGDGHGRTDQPNAKELRTIVLVLRYSGLRISDAVKLERSQLVPSADGHGYGLLVQQQKVRRTVYIPLPDGSNGLPDVVAALRALPPKNEKYFFWSGNGGLDTAVTNWRTRLDKLFKLAESKTGAGKPFSHKPHPHRFRHTFAAEYLLAGVRIEEVSLLLGHASARATERHYAKFNRARQMQVDQSVKSAWKPMSQRLTGLQRRPRKVA